MVQGGVTIKVDLSVSYEGYLDELFQELFDSWLLLVYKSLHVLVEDKDWVRL